MKRYVIFSIVLCFLGIAFAQAQDLRLHVRNHEKEDLPFAYIYVNGSAVAITDSTGRATLSTEKIQEGDTIKAICVGTEPAQVVYTAKLRKQGEYRFSLKEHFTVLTAETVTVTAPANEKRLFQKYFRKVPFINYDAKLTADFSMHIQNTARNAQISGKLEAGNRLSSPDPNPYFSSPYAFFNNQYQLTTANDTTQLNPIIHHQLHLGLDCIHSVIGYIAQGQLGPYNPRYRYLGEEHDEHVFRIVYPDIAPQSGGVSYQILVKLNRDTGHIRRIEFNIFNKGFQGEFQINADFVEYQNQKPRLNTVLIPSRVNYWANYTQSKQKVQFTLSNIQVVYHRWKQTKNDLL